MSFPPRLIAEIGSVHDGSFGNAIKLIEVAAECGVDAVKFQTHIADAETLRDAPMPPYFKGEPRYEYFQRTGFSENQWKDLKSACRDAGVQFISSPFSLEAVELLEKIGIEMYKIPSGEVTNVPLLEKVTETGRPIILSSGMSNWNELDRAMEVLSRADSVAIMQCSSIYPCPPDQVGLNIIQEMRDRYNCPVGFSDHTLGNTAAIAAMVLGASFIEKHLTFSRKMYGSDAPNASEPEEFTSLAQALTDVQIMLSSPVEKDDLSQYQGMKDIFEKSIVTAHPLKKGVTLTEADLAFKKPGDGLTAANYKDVIGRILTRDLPVDHQLSEDDFQ